MHENLCDDDEDSRRIDVVSAAAGGLNSHYLSWSI